MLVYCRWIHSKFKINDKDIDMFVCELHHMELPFGNFYAHSILYISWAFKMNVLLSFIRESNYVDDIFTQFIIE